MQVCDKVHAVYKYMYSSIAQDVVLYTVSDLEEV